MNTTLVVSFELSQRQNLLYAALNTIFTTQDQQTTKRIKNEMKESSASRYEIQTATLNTDCEDVICYLNLSQFFKFPITIG